MEYTFKDFYYNDVELSFSQNPFSEHPKHVWVVCVYDGKWLLTEHLRRGFEFPGGKVEKGEAPEEAAKREVYEETGGVVSRLTYVGQYRVTSRDKVIVKNIYFAEIERVEQHTHAMETGGSVLLEELPIEVRQNDRYSFIMKDDILERTIQYLKEHHFSVPVV